MVPMKFAIEMEWRSDADGDEDGEEEEGRKRVGMESSEWPSGEWMLTVTDVTSFLFQVKGSLEAALDLKLINFSTNFSLTQHFFLFISLFSVFIGEEIVSLLFCCFHLFT